MGRVSRDARLLFVLMWTLADDSGRLRGNSRMLASLLFPYDDDAPKLISDWLEELEQQKSVIRYEADDGCTYAQIVAWEKHQKIDKPSKSRIPEPDSRILAKALERSAKPRECSSGDQGPRTKDQDQGSRTKDRDQGSYISSADRGHSARYPDAFERFWEKYPPGRKNKKAEAFRRWKAALKSPGVTPELLTQRAADYACSPQGQSEFVRMPSTWLSGGCWDDDPESWQVIGSETVAQRRERATQDAGQRFVEQFAGDEAG